MNRSNRKPTRLGRRHRRRAALLILACLVLTTTMIFCGLVIDVGNLNVARTELQRGADAAALAAVAEMMEQSDWTSEPNTSVVSYHARNAAVEYVGLNPCRGVNTMTLPRNDGNAPSGDLVLGHYNSTTGVFDPNDTRYNAVHLFLRRDDVQNGPIRLFFGGLVGMRAVNAFAQARAYSETNISGFRITDQDDEGVTCPLLPFSLHEKYWDDNANEDNPIVLFPGWDPEDDGMEAPGNFGTVNLVDKPDNSAADLFRVIRDGLNVNDFKHCPNNTLELDGNGELELNGDTGVVAAMRPYIDEVIRKCNDDDDYGRIIAIHSEVNGQGNRAYFKVIGFAGVKLVRADLTGALRGRRIEIVPHNVRTPCAVGGGEDGVTSRFIASPARLMAVK